MTLRFGPRELVFGVALAILLFVLLVAPFAAHTYWFVARLRANEEKWSSLAVREYQLDVASNSTTDCTGGWNLIVVEDGQLIEGENDEHDHCALGDFEQLKVEALFDRVWDECVYNRSLRRPFPMCNVAYDETHGFPTRIDTYTFDADGEYRPSITVERIAIIH